MEVNKRVEIHSSCKSTNNNMITRKRVKLTSEQAQLVAGRGLMSK